MKIQIEEAHALVAMVMRTYGYDEVKSKTIADHLIDSELRGFGPGGLARAVTVTERLDRSAPFQEITVLNETASSVALDGGDQLGYIVAKQLTERVIEKAHSSASVVGTAKNTWCSGMSTYYLEMITDAGLMGFIASSGGPFAAPFGGSEARFGTNPVAFGFPTTEDPVIWDIGTSSHMLAELTVASKTGSSLETGAGFDSAGAPTTDASEILAGGAMTTWGGHKGSGLALSAQLLGMMAGSAIAPPWLTDMGFFMFVVDPDALSCDFAEAATSFVESVRDSRPLDPARPVRIPFERSIRTRDAKLAAGEIEVDDQYVVALREVLNRRGNPT